MITVVDINFFSHEKETKCALSIANTSDFCLENLYAELSNDELKKLHSVGIEKRKKQYCLGRITTKKALGSFVEDLAFEKINVVNEKSGCPIIENSDYSTSITHTDKIVASLVFENKFSFGIDIEEIKREKIEALSSVICNREPIPHDPERLTVAWTLKETLSKALKCGFYMAFENFELSEFSENDQIFICSYLKYPEFKGIAFIHENNSYAVTYPTNIEKFQESYLKNFMSIVV
ncbi:MAG: 4'-phosphopantetheinyl transferase superfamily protein [Holosporaceae bacterium]|jgi:phosphopantetheinyl transferase|nr:4'-phosphopantetheinyl transferase superfamily protein [Holosporaceae bacterium]